VTGFLQSLSFAFPQALWALLALPVIWWLLRFTPPRPLRIEFPPYRLLLALLSKEEQPDRTPWWLIVLRLALAGLIILAVAGPILGSTAPRPGDNGPLLVVVDDGWEAARSWSVRRAFLHRLLDEAERHSRPVAIATTTPRARPDSLALSTATEAREKAATVEPRALGTKRLALLDRLKLAFSDASSLHVVWLSDGIDTGSAKAFAEGLMGLAQGQATAEAILPPTHMLGPALLAPRLESDGMKVTVLRPTTETGGSFALRAKAGNGRTLAERQLNLAATDTRRDVTLELPLELRNELARVEIAGESSAGAVQLIDDRWRRKVVGIVTGASLELAQPLLSPLYYASRALEPYAEVREPPDAPAQLRDFVAAGLSMLVLADIGILPADSRQTIADWVEEGGVLLRFAGPRLAGGHDDLIPVDLRTGGRELGSALSWEAPQGVAEFHSSSPFAGLPIDPDVKIRKQVLAEPSAELPERIWAALKDGTPLVTAAKRGRGLIVFFHVTANSDWSNLLLSGLFEQMLRRILDFSRGAGEAGSAGPASQEQAFTPLHALNGFGEMANMPVDAQPIAASDIETARPSERHPAGLYARAGATRALNLVVEEGSFRMIGTLPGGVRRVTYEAGDTKPLAGYLLALAVVLFIADTLAAMTLSGAWQRLRRGAATSLFLVAALLGSAKPTAILAQTETRPASNDAFAMAATETTRMAYVRTGDDSIDELTRAGLKGLGLMLEARTAVEPAEPIAIDIERDDIVFFPLLYWAVSANQPDPSEQAIAKLGSFMKNGGTVFFDTRDAAAAIFNPSGISTETAALRRMLARLDIPPLEPVPDGHVLTKAFYLLDAFPGRSDQGQLWVESSSDQGASADGVTSIIIGSNDYAAAWATDGDGIPMLPVSPGGERQREFAYRAGINIVMYALTGNYKSDQVHVPALLERLGQ
jgi:hypothetical protein